jgi:hypothetical protein
VLNIIDPQVFGLIDPDPRDLDLIDPKSWKS